MNYSNKLSLPPRRRNFQLFDSLLTANAVNSQRRQQPTLSTVNRQLTTANPDGVTGIDITFIFKGPVAMSNFHN